MAEGLEQVASQAATLGFAPVSAQYEYQDDISALREMRSFLEQGEPLPLRVLETAFATYKRLKTESKDAQRGRSELKRRFDLPS